MLSILSTDASVKLFLGWLWRSSWQAGMVAAVVLLLRVALGKWISPRCRYALWSLVLLRLLIPVAPESRFSLFGLGSAVRHAVSGVSPESAAAVQRVKPPSTNISGYSVRIGVLPMEPSAAPTVPAAIAVSPAPLSRRFPLAYIPLGIWSAGALYVLIRLFVTNFAFERRVVRDSVPAGDTLARLFDDCRGEMRLARSAEIVHTDAVDAPALMGLFRPRLLLPLKLRESLSTAQLRLVFLHELAHLKCRDIAMEWLWGILMAVHWFNPVLALARRRCRADRELVRDVMVLSVTGPGQVENYGQTILLLVQAVQGRPRSFCPGIVGIVDAKADLRRRIAMIAHFDTFRARHSWLGVVLVLTVGCAALTNPRSPTTQVSDSASPTTATAMQSDGSIGPPLEGPAGRMRLDGSIGPPLEGPVGITSRGFVPLPVGHGHADAQALLDRQIPAIKFDGVSFTDVIDQLRDMTGANIFVNWKALKDGRVEKETPVSARLFNLKFSKVLQVVVDSVSTPQTKVGYYVDNGVICIDSGDNVNKNNLITQIHDIRDLIVPIENFKAPDFGGVMKENPATLPAAEKEQSSKQQLSEKVINLIKETVAADSWDHFGRIKELAGQLIITQTPDNHASIAQLLAQLRETHGIQVSIEARFLVVEKATADKFKLEAAQAFNNTGTKPSDGTYLSENQVAKLLHETQELPKSQLETAPRITCFNSQQACVMISTETAYVSGWETLTGGQGQVKHESVKRIVQTGLLLEMRPTVSADRKFITLYAHPILSGLDRMDSEPFPNSPPGEKLFIQRPVTTIRELRTTVSIPNGETLVLGGFSERSDKPSTQPVKSEPRTQPIDSFHDALRNLGPDRLLFLLVKPTVIFPPRTEDKAFPLVQSRPASP